MASNIRKKRLKASSATGLVSPNIQNSVGVSTVPVPVHTPVQKLFSLPCGLENDSICKIPGPIPVWSRNQSDCATGAPKLTRIGYIVIGIVLLCTSNQKFSLCSFRECFRSKMS